jgi:predicted thioredoxin/glutaredoxin
MHEQLQSYLGVGGPAVEVLDVDRDPDLQRRFGHKVPVLMLDGEVVCFGTFDRAEVERLTRARA